MAVELNTSKIQFETATLCLFRETYCIDNIYGYAFPDVIPINNCQTNHYIQLYAGVANKIVEDSGEHRPLYVVDIGENDFAFEDIDIVNLCFSSNQNRITSILDSNYRNY